MRGATIHAMQDDVQLVISIHAPHAGRDGAANEYFSEDYHISIHAPHAGRD